MTPINFDIPKFGANFESQTLVTLHCFQIRTNRDTIPASFSAIMPCSTFSIFLLRQSPRGLIFLFSPSQVTTNQIAKETRGADLLVREGAGQPARAVPQLPIGQGAPGM